MRLRLSPLLYLAVSIVSAMILTALSAGAAFADKRVALIIGNSGYASIKPLKNPGNDAPDLAAALRSIGFDVIIRTDATKNDFDRAMAEFSRKSVGADVALFYYAGHGVQYQGRNFLLPTDIEVQDVADVKFQAVDAANVNSAFEEARGVKVLILDACRDNPFSKSKVAVSRNIGGRGLARIDRTEGMIVVYATAPEQVALDGDDRNSPFAEALIKRIGEPGIEISAMFRRVAADVYEKTNKRQRPEISSDLISDFYLNPTENDRFAWDRVRESLDSADFRKFIQRFPNSPFARDAQIRIDLFERLRQANEDRNRNDDRQRQDARVAIDRADAQKRESDRIEAEARAAAERAKADAARLARQQGDEAARIEAQRKQEEKRVAEDNKRVAALEQRAAAEAAARAEARRKQDEKAAAEEAARLEARRRQDEKYAADEAKRIAALQQSTAAEAAAKAEAKRKLDEKIAADERARVEAERRQADARRRQDEKNAADETQRLAALELKAAADRKAEFEKSRLAAVCDRETDELKSLVGARQPESIEAFRKRATCPTIGVVVDRELADMRKAIKLACTTDRDALATIKPKDLAALRGALDRMTCEAVRTDTQTRIARLEDEARKSETACADESRTFKAIDATGLDAQTRLKDFRADVACAAVRADVDQALAQVETRARAAQTELARIGCYAGPVNGKLDSATQKSVGLYFTSKGEPTPAQLTDGLVSSLKTQNLKVCPDAPTIAAPAKPADAPVEAATPRKPKAQSAKRQEVEEDEPVRPKAHRRERPEPVAKPRRERPEPVIARPRRERPEPVARARAPAPAPIAHAPRAPAPVASGRPSVSIHGSGF